MCRNIKPLFNFDPPATDEEIHEAALQYVRNLSGFTKPSEANKKAFEQAIKQISKDTRKMLDSLTTNAKPHNREIEAERARLRNEKRFGVRNSPPRKNIKP